MGSERGLLHEAGWSRRGEGVRGEGVFLLTRT